MGYQYKTYSYCYNKNDIKNILIKKGYRVQSMSKVISMIPSIADKKRELFLSKNNAEIPDYPLPGCLYSTRFAWKTKEEFNILCAALEIFSTTWKNNSTLLWGEKHAEDMELCDWRIPREIKKFSMEFIFGIMLKEALNKVENI